MKEVFKCDYCNYIGTKEEIEEHEKVCLNNPDVKCCYNCQCTEQDLCVLYTGAPIPEKKICKHYRRRKPGRAIPV